MLEILHICATNELLPESVRAEARESADTPTDISQSEEGTESDVNGEQNEVAPQIEGEELPTNARPGQEGAARLECRTTLANALGNFMTHIPSHIIRDGLFFLDASMLW